eukprot:g9919.t1
MGDALIWTKALAVSVVFWTALLLLASQQLRAKLFAACVQFRCALHSRPSARECSWAKYCNRSQVVTLADEKQAAEVKASFRKRRPIGVLTRTGPDGVKRAHFFGRAEDIWEFAKEEKRKATSPADEQDDHAGAAGGMDPGAGRRGAGGVSPTRNREQGRSSALLGEMAPSSSFWDLLNSNPSGAFEKHVTRSNFSNTLMY